MTQLRLTREQVQVISAWMFMVGAAMLGVVAFSTDWRLGVGVLGAGLVWLGWKGL